MGSSSLSPRTGADSGIQLFGTLPLPSASSLSPSASAQSSRILLTITSDTASAGEILTLYRVIRNSTADFYVDLGRRICNEKETDIFIMKKLEVQQGITVLYLPGVLDSTALSILCIIYIYVYIILFLIFFNHIKPGIPITY